MKDIQTSNYARKGTSPNAIAISATIPEWYIGKWMRSIAPEWDDVKAIINGEIDFTQYAVQYINLLVGRGMTPNKILDALPDNCYLLCYESPTDPCHRRILANWIQQETGVIIPEWKTEQEQMEHEQELKNNTLLTW